jgi:outer membrane lipoprotein carrier protein
VRRLGLALAGLLLLSAQARAAAPPPTVDELIDRLTASTQGVHTLAGEFNQRNRLKLFQKELRSRGRFFFRRPRQIRWEYTAPDPSTLVLDGEKATLSTPGAPPQVFDLERDATMRTIFDQLLLWLTPSALDRARGEYEMSVGGSAAEPTLVLVPRAQSAIARAFARIELRLDGKTLLLRAIALTERNGDQKEIVFSKLQRNAPLPSDAFH